MWSANAVLGWLAWLAANYDILIFLATEHSVFPASNLPVSRWFAVICYKLASTVVIEPMSFDDEVTLSGRCSTWPVSSRLAPWFALSFVMPSKSVQPYASLWRQRCWLLAPSVPRKFVGVMIPEGSLSNWESAPVWSQHGQTDRRMLQGHELHWIALLSRRFYT
jgi:hypothetical protein